MNLLSVGENADAISRIEEVVEFIFMLLVGQPAMVFEHWPNDYYET